MNMNDQEPLELLTTILTRRENSGIPEGQVPSPGQAYWNQRQVLAEIRPEIEAMRAAIGENPNLTPYQWTQLLAYVLEFKPDLILELGRGEGNSTCVFTTAANRLHPEKCEVVSLCLSDGWGTKTLPKLEKVVPRQWFAPLRALTTNVLTYDYEGLFKGAERILVFWDAHGYDVAECVLGRIMPLIKDTKHVVLAHDMSDGRYMSDFSYGGNGLWRGNDWAGPRLQLGHINSSVEQAVSLVDFCSRNEITLNSADHGLRTFLESQPDRVREMRSKLGETLFDLQAHWFYFSLNGHPGPLTFPNFSIEKIQMKTKEKMALYQELTGARRIINHNKEILVEAAQGLLHGGISLLETEQAERALEKFAMAEKMCVGFDLIGLNYSRAHALVQLGRIQDARTALENELDLDPNHQPSFKLLSYLSKAEGQAQWPGARGDH